jgi:antitoxin ParD1/3/4
MPTRNVVLTDHLAGVVDGLVAKGRYQNASEAIREGVRLLEREEAEMEGFLARIMVGYEQAERGEFVEGSTEEVFGRVMARAEARWAARREDEAKAS